MGFKKKDTKVSFTMQKYLLDCKFSKKKNIFYFNKNLEIFKAIEFYL